MTDIEPYKNNTVIIRLVIDQMVKDFGMFSLPIQFTENDILVYNEMFQQLSGYISAFLKENASKLWALLYYIDLDQKSISKAQTEQPKLDQADIITELVIRRELDKVLSHLHYRLNQDKT